ncbi:MAG: asparagine synthase (glutamine-hydrolyzing) [Halanaerobium sp.]|nr:asparagine synthase (glutamine-hydrolyzing) [Halanaerobium sp.]
MCGIAGWIDLKENIIEKKQVIERMAGVLRKRGPDASGFYCASHALLGHRRLVVVDPSGGAQPMTRYRGDNKYTIVYNGELYNTTELRAQLESRGYNFQSYSDTEVLLLSYLEFSEACVEYLNGIYAFGIWDEEEQTLFLARDRLGVKPLFYAEKGTSFLFGSEIKALLAHPALRPVVDEEGLLEVFGLGPARSPGAGVFKDIREVRPGFSLTYSPKGLSTKRYWQLESRPHQENLDETAEIVRNLFIDAVKRQLVSDVPICTFLSGGLDSSAITSIAAENMRDKGDKLNSFSVDYLDNDLYFAADSFQPAPDANYIGKMIEYTGCSHHNVIIDTPQLAGALREAVLANDLPGMADIDSSLFLFCREVKDYATVALSGECADEIFGGYPWYSRPEEFASNTFPWSNSIQQRKDVLVPALRKLPIEEYVRERYEMTIGEVPAYSGDSEEEEKKRQLFYLNLKWFMITLLNRKDRMSMANSLEVRVPFADHRLVEYAWNIPWPMKFHQGLEKGLLRKAFSGFLPPEITWRRKSPYPKTHNPTYEDLIREELKRIYHDKSSPLLDIVDGLMLQELVRKNSSLERPWFGQLMRRPQLMAFLIQVNIWLKEYKVVVDI